MERMIVERRLVLRFKAKFVSLLLFVPLLRETTILLPTGREERRLFSAPVDILGACVLRNKVVEAVSDPIRSFSLSPLSPYFDCHSLVCARSMRLFVPFLLCLHVSARRPSREDSEEEDEDVTRLSRDEFLFKRMKEAATAPNPKKPLQATPYTIPGNQLSLKFILSGPQEPLPGRSHPGDYWPVFPFQNQFSGGLDLDPSISRVRCFLKNAFST